jgi:hypothetical protein
VAPANTEIWAAAVAVASVWAHRVDVEAGITNEIKASD